MSETFFFLWYPMKLNRKLEVVVVNGMSAQTVFLISKQFSKKSKELSVCMEIDSAENF